MNLKARFWLIVAFTGVLGVQVATHVAQGRYLFPVLLAVAILWLLVSWLTKPLPDAWALAVVIVGYIVGNRGFAQITLIPNFPLLPAEAVLLVAAPAWFIRNIFAKLFVRRDALSLAILAWIAVGAARLPFDVRHHGIVALRDFATVYYAMFFYIALAFARQAASRKLLHLAVGGAFAALPVVVCIAQLAPEFFLTQLTWRGVPLIYHKSDLSAAFLVAGSFWSWLSWRTTGRRLWLVGSAASLLLMGTMGSPRAAMVAGLGVTVFWVLAREYRLVRFQIITVGAALSLALLVSFASRENIKGTAAFATYERLTSILDFEGRGHYVHTPSGDPGDNNRFRLVWWHAVVQETIDESPVFGLGFGYDLAARFLVEYDWIENEEFNVRSPHSILLTVFGRMGTLGIALWLAIAGAMLKQSLRAFRRQEWPVIGYWSVVWSLLISACFGVVLEGPMGAVVFWTLLGLAHGTTAETGKEHEEGGEPREEIAAPATLEGGIT